MSDFSVYPSSDQFVIDSDAGTFAALISIARQMHRPHLGRADLPAWRRELVETFDAIGEHLPTSRSYANMQAMIAAREDRHLGFVSYTARLVVGVDRFVVERTADCLRDALGEADDEDFATITGADLALVRKMFLSASAALGKFAEAHRIVFPRPT